MSTKSKHQGVVTIEFSMAFIFFWWMLMAWIETSYMSYVSAVSDFALSEASRVSRLEDTNNTQCDSSGSNCVTSYKSRFLSALNENNSLWGYFISPDKFTFSIQYLSDINALKNFNDDYCKLMNGSKSQECGVAKNSALAIYRINYEYVPIFNFFITSNLLFTREAIVIQEYELDKFNF